MICIISSTSRLLTTYIDVSDCITCCCLFPHVETINHYMFGYPIFRQTHINLWVHTHCQVNVRVTVQTRSQRRLRSDSK